MNKRISKLKFTLLLTLFISFSSCDHFRICNGFVFDKKIHKPMDSVLVEAYLVNLKDSIFIERVYTDSLGHYDIGTGPLARSGYKMDFIVTFSKSGYKKIKLKNPASATIVKMEQITSITK